MLRKELLKVASIIGAAGRRCKPVLKKANHCFSLPFLIGELLGEEHGLPQLYYFTAEHFFCTIYCQFQNKCKTNRGMVFHLSLKHGAISRKG